RVRGFHRVRVAEFGEFGGEPFQAGVSRRGPGCRSGSCRRPAGTGGVVPVARVAGRPAGNLAPLVPAGDRVQARGDGAHRGGGDLDAHAGTASAVRGNSRTRRSSGQSDQSPPLSRAPWAWAQRLPSCLTKIAASALRDRSIRSRTQ